MKTWIFGLGQMGEATVWAMKQLGYDVMGVDCNVERACKIGREYKIDTLSGSLNLSALIHEDTNGIDIVISCLPYYKNLELAIACIDNNIRYCDLGGRVDVDKNINDYAIKNYNKLTLSGIRISPVFTSLGLAPGLINILAQKEYNNFPAIPDDVSLYVGGLGQGDENSPLFYTCNWSTEGLVNEYLDDCLLLEDGKIVTKPGMSDLNTLHVVTMYNKTHGEWCDYECFNTSGGLAGTLELMKHYGVKNCAYKTLRLPGHAAAIKYFVETLGYNKEQLTEVLRKSCTSEQNDKVVMAVRVSKDNLVASYDKVIYGGRSYYADGCMNDFSAMQRCTAFTLAAVADIMAKGEWDGICTLNYDYAYWEYDAILANLTKLGLFIDDKQSATENQGMSEVPTV